jgi:hypothetical protein
MDTSSLKHIDVGLISSSPLARFEFLADFIGFTDDDQLALQESLGVIAPQLPGLLDAIYDHLLSYDDTRRIFLGERGAVDLAYIEVRKEHLTQWALMTTTSENREQLAIYINSVGLHHTGVEGESGRVVPPRYLIALTSFIQTAILKTAFAALPENPQAALRFGLAWNKMLLIQLEMFLRAVAPHWPKWDEGQE